MDNVKPFIKLNNGIQMPSLGLGTWRAQNGREVEDSVKWALEAGYRLIDTASFYANEEGVGNAVRASGIARGEIFVTTKVTNDDQGYEETKRAFQKSLDNLNIDYIDLYLVHFPVTEKRRETWRAMQEIYQNGKCRAIGVSNYTIKHLKELLADTGAVPAVNQVEFHPFLFQKELVDFCQKQGIALEAYCPLSRAQKISDPRITEIARKHGKTNAQVMIRWSLQHKLVVIPKSVHKKRIKENFEVFDFSLDEVLGVPGLKIEVCPHEQEGEQTENNP